MNPKLSTTTIYLTEEEAKRFVSFQKHYALIGLLDSVNAFNIKSGSVTIHFNALGQIVGVDKQEHFNPNIKQIGI